MTTLRIVANLKTDDPAGLAAFYGDLLQVETLMELGFLVTVGCGEVAPVQLSFGQEGGSGTELPAISVEVSDLDAALKRASALSAPIVYGPVTEPWGVRRFYLRDPAGTLVNIVSHSKAHRQ